MNLVSNIKGMLSAILCFWATNIACAVASENAYSASNMRDSALQAASAGDAELASQIISENAVISYVHGGKSYIFSPQEKILSDFIRYNFGAILSDCRSGINETVGYINKAENNDNDYYLHFDDTLDYSMMDLALSRQEQIESAIEQSKNLNIEEKEFLSIKYTYATRYGRFCSYDNNDLIVRGNAFSTSAQDSLLGKYTSEMLCTPKRAHLNAASDIFGGIFIPNGNIADLVTAGTAIGLSMDFGYERLRLLTDFGFLAGMESKDDFKVNGKDWIEGSSVSGNFVNLGAGFNVSPWSKISVIPYLSMHTSSLRNAECRTVGQRDEPANISSGIGIMGGLAVDYNFVLPFCDDEILGDTERRILFLRLKTSYVPAPYGAKTSSFGGDVVLAHFGIGIYTDNKR